MMLCPGQRLGDLRAGTCAGLGGAERLPVQGGAQHGGRRPAGRRCQEGRGDGGQRVSDRGPGVRGGVRPLHHRIRAGVLQPAHARGLPVRPAGRLASGGAEVQAAPGSADQFGPVTLGQPSGHKRPGLGPARRMPADLERAAPAHPAAYGMNPHIKHVHGSPLTPGTSPAPARQLKPRPPTARIRWSTRTPQRSVTRSHGRRRTPAKAVALGRLSYEL